MSEKENRKVIKAKRKQKKESKKKTNIIQREGFLDIGGAEGVLLQKLWDALSLCGITELSNYLDTQDSSITQQLSEIFQSFPNICASDETV